MSAKTDLSLACAPECEVEMTWKSSLTDWIWWVLIVLLTVALFALPFLVMPWQDGLVCTNIVFWIGLAFGAVFWTLR